ncbi:MAG: hypothetical protein MK005_12720 [Alcanivorax sp.]|nr:hypothetical protein [Alcanivorax sp.]
MNVSMKKGLLALAGAVALAGAGAVQAETYSGTTTLNKPGAPTAVCTLTINGSISGSGAVSVSSGDVTGNALCDAIQLSNFNWTGTLSNTSGAGTTTLSTPIASVPGTFECSGTVTGISYPSVNGDGYPPQFVISGTSNFGDCSLSGTLNLE